MLVVLPLSLRGAGALVLALILAGGTTCSLGAVVTRGNGPTRHRGGSGSHEVFHAATIVAYLTEHAAVSRRLPVA